MKIWQSSLVIALSLLPSAYTALVFLHAWEWFVIPLGAVGITYWHAFGLKVLFTLLRPIAMLKPEDKSFGECMAFAFGRMGAYAGVHGMLYLLAKGVG